MLSKLTLADATGTDIVLHEDTATSKRVLLDAKGLVGVGPLRASKRVRPQAHGSINETQFEEGRTIQLTGEVFSNISIEQALEEFRKLVVPMVQTLDNGAALLKWTEGATGQKLQMLVKLDSEVEPTLKEAAGMLTYPVQFFAEDPRAYSQTETTQTGAAFTPTAPETSWLKTAGSGAPGLAIDGAHIYWANEKSIGRATLAGGTLEPEWVKTSATPTSIAVDGSHVYWTSTAGIGRSTLAGATIENSWITNVSAGTEEGRAVRSVAVDASHVYWSGGNAGIGRAALAGTSPEAEWIGNSAIGASAGAGVVAVDSAHIYWSGQRPGGWCIGRATIAGAEANPEYITGVVEPSGIVATASFLYWTNGTTARTIGRAKLTGAEVIQSFVIGIGVRAFSLAVNASNIFWNTNGFVARTVIGGGGSGSSITIAQAGNRPTPVTFKIRGPIENPVIVRESDGARITLAGTIAAGNYVEIDVAKRTVRLNGVSNELSLVEAAGTEWSAGQAPANPSSATYVLRATSATAAVMETLYRSAYA